ncbi:MAG: heavy metal translocating P-type ATPase [Chloroflexota bacterium]
MNQKKHLATVLLAPAADSKLSRSTNALEKQGMGQSLLSNIDSHYQTFVRTRLDPLLSGQAHQHQMALRSGNDDAPPPGELEKHINRRFGLAVLTLANTVLATIFFPPLIIFSLASALYPVGYYFVDAYRDLTQERRVSLNLIGALYVSGMWLARYFLFGSFALVLFAVGSKVRFLMEGRSREGIQTIFGQQSRYAWLVVDGVEIETPVEELQVGDIVVVNAGEAIPVDGVMVKGIALVDQHALTGESQPIEKILGDSVFASTLMLTGRASIQVKKAGSETTAAQINEILIQTAEHRTEIESRGLELANKGALPTLLTGLVAYPLFGLTGAVAALGAGFGYNLRTVSILSMMNYVQVAARKAVLIKDGRALERLDEVDTIVFDKTGTLTLEQPHVAQIHCLQEHLTENDVLTYAAAAEYRQPHPIAKAIIATSEERNLTLPEIDEASYEVGYGIQVTVGKQLIRVGSERFMKMEGIVIPESIRTLQAACQHQGHSLVMVALDAQLIGALELHATLRPEVETVLTDLRHRNLNLAIISGDQEEPTRALAQSLGIDSYYANVLPEDKALLIKQLQDEGRIVCFIGDGINDAIALKQADVSVSLLGATTIATDTAQIVLMDQSLTRLGELLDLATNFDTTIRHGFWTTMVPGFVCIGGVFFLHFGIIASELLFQLGFFTGLGVAMKPLLDEQRENTSFV